MVKGPQQKGFSVEAWKRAFQLIQNPDARDKALFMSCAWFAVEFENVRRMTGECANLVQSHTPIDAILGFVTHQWAVIKDKTQKAFDAIAQNKEFVSEQISEIRITNVMGAPFDPEVALESLVDGTRFPLSFRFLAPTPSKPPEAEQLKALTAMFLLGGYYHTLEQRWLACVWNDYMAISAEGHTWLVPCPWGTHKTQAITRFRQETRYREYATRAANMWLHDLPGDFKKRVLSRKHFLSSFKRNGKTRVKLTPATAVKSELKAISVTRIMLTHEYLEPLNHKPRPEFAGLCIAQVLDAYELLSHLPDQILTFLPRKMEIHGIEEARRYTPKLDRSELKTAFQKALAIRDTQAIWLIDYLTFNASVREQLWFKPLVKLSDSLLGLVVPAVDGVNFLRLTDHLLKEIKSLEEEIGVLFEQHVRAELLESAAGFKYKDRLKVMPGAVRFDISPTEREEIDLVYALGNKIYIGEDKAILFPSEQLEVFRYIETLAGGAEQAQRKADFVKNHLPEFLKATKLDRVVDASLATVCPLVVTNSPFFSGFELMGVPVSDLFILPPYFRTGHLKKSAYTNAKGQLTATSQETFYETEQQAIDNHEAYLRKPPQLTAFEPYATLDDVEYVIPFDPPHSIHIRLYQMHLPYAKLRAEIQKHRAAESAASYKQST